MRRIAHRPEHVRRLQRARRAGRSCRNGDAFQVQRVVAATGHVDERAGADLRVEGIHPEARGAVDNPVAGIQIYDTSTTGVEIFNNTFHGGAGFVAPVIDIASDVTVATPQGTTRQLLGIGWTRAAFSR